MLLPGVLDLQFNNLNGEVPAGLFTLPSLATLRVNDNRELTGSIPTTVGQMVSLQEIWLNATSVGGTIPEAIYTLPKLTNLHLADADFSGPLSESVGQLSQLRFLDLHENRFSGPIPTGLNSLTRLSKFVVPAPAFMGILR